MKPFDVLSRATPIFGNHLLEASAGTGKTFAIQHLVQRFVMEGIPLDEIVVVTFTRVAARELKTRIRKTLESARQQQDAPDYFMALEPEDKRRALRRIEEALVYFECAQIFTIHGFCHRMLQEFAFEAGVNVQVSHPDEGEHHSLMRQAVRDFLRTGIKPESYSPRQLGILLKQKNQSIEKLEENLIQLIEKNGEIPLFSSFQMCLDEYREAIRLIPSVHPDRLMEDFERLSSCYKEMTGRGWKEQVLIVARHLETRMCSSSDFDELLKEKVSFLDRMVPKNKKVRAILPSEESLHYPNLFPQLQEKLLPPLINGRDPVKLLMRLASECRTVCFAQLEKEGVMPPDTLLQKMRQAVNTPAFREHIQKKYRAAIVDEFQDTDPVQWAIFQTLFLSPDRSPMEAVYLVGDPKQSIYAFRSADVYTYLAAKSVIGEDCCFSLNTNYRSTHALIEALNLLFSKAAGGKWLTLPQKNLALDYQPVQAHHPSYDLAQEGVHFFIAEESSGRERKWPTETMEETLFFPFIAHEIKRRNAEYSGVAVLVKDRYQAIRVQKFLQGSDIPSSIKRTENLAETTAFYCMKQLLKACSDPENISQLKVVLGGACIGWTFDQLANKPETARIQFKDLADTLRRKGFISFFYQFLNMQFENTEETVIQRLASQKDLSLYNDVYQIGELCMEHQAATPTSPEGILYLLQQLETKDPEEENRLKRKAGWGTNRVTILTTHMSKGLEFEVVFAIGLASRHTFSEEWIAVQQEEKATIIPFDSTKRSCQIAAEEADAEKMRQLYVALTRAKTAVYIPIAFDREQRNVQSGAASPVELFISHLTQANTAAQFIAAIDGIKAHTQIHCHLMPHTPVIYPLRKLPEIFSVAEQSSAPFIQFSHTPTCSFSSLAKKSDHSVPFIAITEEKNFYTLPAGAHTGALLHEILEKVISYRLHAPLNRMKIEELVQEKVFSTHLEEWKNVVFEMIVQTLTLVDLPPNHIQQEMEFLFSIGNVSMKGFADLIFEKEGKYYILDWKSNWLGPSSADYTPEKLKTCMESEDYFFQAAIYASALEQYLKIYNKPLATCFGGAIYVFLRAPALYTFIPDPTLFAQRLIDRIVDKSFSTHQTH